MDAWIGVPEYIADVPEPLQFGSKLGEIVSSMQAKGMNETTKIVIAAHSLQSFRVHFVVFVRLSPHQTSISLLIPGGKKVSQILRVLYTCHPILT